MAAYDQSLGRLRGEQESAFWKSSAERWRAAFDHVVSALDEDDPDTATVLEEAERLRQSIPLQFDPPPIDV